MSIIGILEMIFILIKRKNVRNLECNRIHESFHYEPMIHYENNAIEMNVESEKFLSPPSPLSASCRTRLLSYREKDRYYLHYCNNKFPKIDLSSRDVRQTIIIIVHSRHVFPSWDGDRKRER